MSATMARQGGRVQLEQSDMRLALNMAKIAKGGFSHTAIEETEYLIKVREEKKKYSVEVPGHKKVKATIERDPAMLCQNHLPRCLHWQNCTARNPQTRWRCKDTGVPPPNRRRQQTPEPTSPLPGTATAINGNTSGSQFLVIVNLPPGYAYSHTSLPCAERFTLDLSAQNSEHYTDFDPDMLPDEGTSTG